MAGFSEFWKMFGFKPTRLSKAPGRGRFGMEPTANWEMSAKCVIGRYVRDPKAIFKLKKRPTMCHRMVMDDEI
jgi:hypothetical protein